MLLTLPGVPVVEEFDLFGFKFRRNGHGDSGMDKTLRKGINSWWRDACIYKTVVFEKVRKSRQSCVQRRSQREHQVGIVAGGDLESGKDGNQRSIGYYLQLRKENDKHRANTREKRETAPESAEHRDKRVLQPQA